VEDCDVADRIARGFLKGMELVAADKRTMPAPQATGEIYNRLRAFAKRISPGSESVTWPPPAQIDDGHCQETFAELTAYAGEVRALVATLNKETLRGSGNNLANR
jgi:hypothetical protein